MRAAASRWKRWRKTSIRPSRALPTTPEGSLHFVCHSMGGLLARVYLVRHRPARLGRVVMLGTPNGGSELADSLKGFWRYRAWFGPAGQQLGTQRDDALDAHASAARLSRWHHRWETGRSIRSRRSGCRSRMTGGCRCERTKLDGMADHVVVGAVHPWLPRSSVGDRADDSIFAKRQVRQHERKR